MLKKASSILIKLSPLLDIKSIINDLPHVAEIHIVSVKNECKEVLVLLKPNFKYEPIIRAINLQSEEQEYTFKHTEESSTELTLGELADYLFEPNASILKAGAFKKVAIDFSLVKLHANTHLYTVNEPKPNLPGRLFKVIEKAHIDSDVLEKYAPEKLINVLTRNYPVRPDELKKKFKIRDGGDYFLIGFRDIKGKARLVVAEKV